MSAFAIVFAAAIQVAAQIPSIGSSIVGCVSDATTQRIPGATIILKGRGVERTTTTDTTGCYALEELPPTVSYRVTARLLGFDNLTRDGVVPLPGAGSRVDFILT